MTLHVDSEVGVLQQVVAASREDPHAQVVVGEQRVDARGDRSDLVGGDVAGGAVGPGRVGAQDRPATLATLFEDIFGPSGLVVSSDEVALDGTNHAAPTGEECETDRRGGNCPSRTAVDLRGSVYVANRAFFGQGTSREEAFAFTTSDGRTVRGYLVRPANAGTTKLPAVLVIHENRGLNPHIEDIARRLAADNFVAFAPDALFPLGGYPGNEDKAKLLFAEFAPTVDFFERTVGPYPFGTEKIAAVETPHLGMEHQTINAYGNEYKPSQEGYDWLFNHEFAHEWFGNQLTNRNWDDMWLHEGLGTYSQALYAERLKGPEAYRHVMGEQRQGIGNRGEHGLVSEHFVCDAMHFYGARLDFPLGIYVDM